MTDNKLSFLGKSASPEQLAFADLSVVLTRLDATIQPEMSTYKNIVVECPKGKEDECRNLVQTTFTKYGYAVAVTAIAEGKVIKFPPLKG